MVNETPEQEEARLKAGNRLNEEPRLNETPQQREARLHGTSGQKAGRPYPETDKQRLDTVPDSDRIKSDALARGESYAKSERLRAESVQRGESNPEAETHRVEKTIAEDKEARFNMVQNETPEQRTARLDKYPNQIVGTYPNRASVPYPNEELVDYPNETPEQRAARRGVDSGPGSYGRDGLRIKEDKMGSHQETEEQKKQRLAREANETPEQRKARLAKDSNGNTRTTKGEVK